MPAEVTLEQIEAEIARRERATRLQAGAGGDPITVEAIDAEIARRQQQPAQGAPSPREQQLTRNYTPMGGAVASLSQGATLGFSDEIEGGMEAIRRGGTEALRMGPDWMGRVGRAAGEGYNDARDTTNAFVTRNREEAPIMSAVNEIGGAITTGGAGLANAGRATGQRGFPLLANQISRGVTTGATAGYTYGFGSGEGDFPGRMDNANRGAAAGAAFGAVAPAGINLLRGAASRNPMVAWPSRVATVGAGAAAGSAVDQENPARGAMIGAAAGLSPALARPAWEALSRARVDPNRVGTAGGNVTMSPRGQPPRRLPPAAAGTIDRLADRARMSPAQIEASLAGARRNPQGQVLADVFDEPGRQTTRALAQWPGQTGQRARETYRARGGEQTGRLVGALRKGLRVGETRGQALARLKDEYRRASAETYGPLFRAPLAPERAPALEQGMVTLATSPTMARAMRRARELIKDERAAGLVDGAVETNPAQLAHYIKLALDDLITRGRRDSSLVGNQMRATIELRNRVTALLDEALPEGGPGGGYREARSRWGGIANAEEALDEGAEFLNMMPAEVRARLAQMTDFEKLHARIGIVDEITRGMRGGRVVGQKNVANALDYRDTQEVIAAAFDTPQQAADFLDVLNTSNQLMQNASTWLGGSSTAANVAHGADEALNVAGDMAGDVMTGRPGQALARGVRKVANAATLGMVERANNQRGEALLTRIDTPEAEEFGRQVVAELRRRAAIRAQNSGASAATAGAGGVGVNRRGD